MLGAVAAMNFSRANILRSGQFARADVERVFDVADRIAPYARRERATRVLEGAILSNLFFEPSTRTRISFGCAFNMLGGEVRETTGMEHSALSKGESLHDTARVLSGYSDAIVMRHPGAGAVARFAEMSRVPVLNGGDGDNEHPSQALLDLYTVREELGGRARGLDGLRIALVGDLRFGRTAHSLCRLLALFKRVSLHLVSPPELQMPGDVVDCLEAAGHTVRQRERLVEGIAHVDIIYATRVQQERLATQDPQQIAAYQQLYRINRAIYTEHCESNTVIMHPMPRDSRHASAELDSDLDEHPNLAIFRQADCGVLIRMALFALIFDVVEQVDDCAYTPSWRPTRRH